MGVARIRRAERLTLLLAGWLLPAWAGAAASQPGPDGFAGFVHSRWTSKDGVPAMVQALAQTPDGYLWLGTGNGLYRFDGVSFEHVPPAAGHPAGSIPVSAVTVTRRGDLWIGYTGGGGVEVRRGGRLVRTAMPQPPGEVTQLAEDAEGAIWAVAGRSREALRRYRHGRWETIGHRFGIPRDEYVSGLLVARDGTIWVATHRQLLVLHRGERRFARTGFRVVEGADLAEDRHGIVWLSDPLGTRALPGPADSTAAALAGVTYAPRGPVRRTDILFDRQGGLWGSTFTGGIFRIADPMRGSKAGRVDAFRAGDGLSSDQAVAVLEDREGNIWAATELGLDQFRPANVVRIRPPAPSSPTGYYAATDATGAVYLLAGPTLYRAMPGGDPVAVLGGIADGQALCRGRDGTIWLAVPGRMLRLRHGRVIGALRLPGTPPTFGCGEDRTGSLWVARFDRGLLRHDRRAWHRVALPVRGRPQDIVIDDAGRPIVILDRRALVRLDGRHVTVWSGERIGVAGLTVVHCGPTGLLIGGGDGLARWRDGRFERLAYADHPWLRGVRGIVQTADGHSWLVNNSGIIHVASALLEQAFAAPRRPIPHRVFDELDGLTSRMQRLDGAQAVLGGDGRIWALTRQGVVRVAPARLAFNPAPPPVMIRSLLTDRRHYVDPTALALAAGTRNLSIEYTALSLSVPSRVRFRYMLEGVDRSWIDPGTRRQAFYTNLDPGTYRFRVVAANDAGVWNRTGATLAFTIPPTFVQSRPFLVLCGAAAAALLWLVYRIKLRAVAVQLRTRMRERTAERERIARELHDTLLQGVQALVLRVQLVADDIGPDQPARRALEEALDRADDVLAEGRDRVRGLRPIGGGDDIELMIREIARKQAFPATTHIAIMHDGEPRPLDPLVWDEVARIANEALFNIWRHADASRIEISIGFRSTVFRIGFRDNGVGLDHRVLRDGRRDGHYGLVGMRERARKIGAELALAAPRGGGLQVTLTVPGTIAYVTGTTRRARATAGDLDD